MNLKQFIATTIMLSIGSIGSSLGASSNYVSIDIDEMNYKLPEAKKGIGGNIIFPRVKMSWDEMKVSLKNTSSLLDAEIKMRPTYIKFQTPGVGISFPFTDDSAFFTIDQIELQKSKFLLNQDFFNFDGELFMISDGTSKLVLDKFNMYCNAPDAIDMTSLDGLVHGCLSEFILNGQEDTDLAGAQIDYYDTSDKENGLFLTSRLKDLKLENSKIKLDLKQATLDVLEYQVAIGASKIECSKDPKLKEIDVDNLKNSCLNEISITAPDVKVKNKNLDSEIHISLTKMGTTSDELIAILKSVSFVDAQKSINLEDIEITCERTTNSEFYNLNHTIDGCVESATIRIPRVTSKISSKEKTEKGWFGNLFGSDEETTSGVSYATNIEIKIKDNKLDFFAVVDPPYFPRFKLKFDAHISHEFNEDNGGGRVGIEVMNLKAIKVWKMQNTLKWIANFFFSEDENIQIKGNRIYYIF
jgi:hypothetical protein